MVAMFCEKCEVYSSKKGNTKCLLCNAECVVRDVLDNNDLYELEIKDGAVILLQKQPKPICRLLDAPDVVNKIEEIRAEVIKLRKWGNLWKKIALSKVLSYDCIGMPQKTSKRGR